MMSGYESDPLNMMRTSTGEPTVIGQHLSSTADGSIVTIPVVEVEVEVTILDNKRMRMTILVRVQYEVYRG